MEKFDHLLIIPTLALRTTLLRSIALFVRHVEPNTIIAISVNPKDPEEASVVVDACRSLIDAQIKMEPKENLVIEFVGSSEPIGFAGAINKAYEKITETYGNPKYVTIANDDLIPTSGWMKGLRESLEEELVYTPALVETNKSAVPVDTFGKIGIVGPMSPDAYGEQGAFPAKARKIYELIGLPEFSRDWRNNMNNLHDTDLILQNWLSGFCMMIKGECAEELIENRGVEGQRYRGFFDDVSFPIGGYEDDDLCLRARQLGWRAAISGKTVVGHMKHGTLLHHFPDAVTNSGIGLQNFIHYLLKWEHETQREKRVIAAYRVSIKNINEIVQLQSSISRVSQMVEGISLVLTNDPSDALESYDKGLLESLSERERMLFQKFASNPDDAHNHIKEWAVDVCRDGIDIVTERWEGEFNERDERNRSYKIAEEMGADFIFSVDADEVPEDRFSPQLFKRMIHNPHPAADCMYVSFLNHWENMNLIRVDPPFAYPDAPMQGPRIWKVHKNSYQPVVAGNDVGLHCGNCPEHSIGFRRQTPLRMRHLSHVRAIDRNDKFKFYSTIDNDRHKTYLGQWKDYAHIVKQEGVDVSIYNPRNGIAAYMLCYSKESPHDVGSWFDSLYQICDRIALVWTDEWSSEDQEWVSLDPHSEWPSQEDWSDKYKTGPCWELAHFIRLYRVELLIKTLSQCTEGLAECRNAAIDHFRQTNNGSIGWVLSVDPDEQRTQSHDMSAALKRMAEINDVWGWMFRFNNPTNGGQTDSFSETVRMVKLDDAGIVRMQGIVHEGYEDSFNELMEMGIHPNVKYAPFTMVNRGLMGTPESMGVKLEKYNNMLIKQLQENPMDTGAWVSLGLQYVNDGDEANAEICYERACMCAGGAFLGYKEFGFHLARKATYMFAQTAARLNKGHPFYNTCIEIVESMSKLFPQQPIIDTGEFKPSKSQVLPDFPYDRIETDDEGNFVVKPETGGDENDLSSESKVSGEDADRDRA